MPTPTKAKKNVNSDTSAVLARARKAIDELDKQPAPMPARVSTVGAIVEENLTKLHALRKKGWTWKAIANALSAQDIKVGPEYLRREATKADAKFRSKETPSRSTTPKRRTR